MNKYKKICLSILATVLCFAMLLIVPMVTKAGTVPTIVVSDAEASAGQEVSVTIALKNNPGIASMMLYVEYDTTALTLKKVKDTGLLSGQVHPSSMEVYPYPLTWENDSINENLTVNGNIVTLTFDVADNITTKKVVDINVSYDNSEYDIYDVDLNTVDFAVDNGTVTIDKMPTPVALENGSVAIQSFGVDKSGDVPVAKASAYKDYLFAGWFTSADCTMENAITDASKVTSDSYAKFISSEVLGVKAQVATDESNIMRFISSVDSLVYKNVGFEVTPVGGTKKSYETVTVYERVVSDTNGVEYKFSPKVVDTLSEYFITAKLRAEENKDYTVRVYVTTMDGQKVYGPARTIGLLDGKAANVLNLSYKSDNAPTVGSQISATYGKDNSQTTADVIAVDGKDVTVRVNMNPSTLPSATKFTFETTGSTIYRNLYTKYTGEGTDDQTWYDVYLAEDSTETEFTIATNADMYGFMNMYAGKNIFKGKTLYVISDIAMNDNVSKAVVESWANGTVTAPYKWNPSGDDTTGTRFQGTFDGQMHTLSGFYVNEDNSNYANYKYAGTYAGLFGSVDFGGVVKNFYLTDSYMTTTGGRLSTTATTGTMYAYLGSVAGENRGTVKNVYSNAILATSGERAGGIVGVHNTTSDVAAAGMQATIDNCWFDGEVRLLGETGKVGGGIAGLVMQRESTMKNLLFTGKVMAETTSEAYVGGILGTESNQSGVRTNYINMEDCVAVGTVTAGEGATSVGSAIGKVTADVSVHRMINVYADSAKGTLVGTGTADYPGMSIAVSSLYGTDIYRNTLLDVNGTWYARTNDTPVLRTFDEKYDKSTVVTDFSGLKQDNWFNSSTKGYGIYTVSAFEKFSELSLTKTFSGHRIYLMADIDLNPGWTAPSTTTEAVTGSPKAWTPIGQKTDFYGYFDGRGHKISGAYVYDTSGKYSASIFGDIWTGTVCNFSVYNSYFYTNYAFAGGAVGAAMKNSTVSNIYSEAIVTSPARQSGGIVGRAEGTISNCWFNGKISSTVATGSIAMGGIVGASRHTDGGLTVKNCLNTGEIIYNVEGNTDVLGIGGIYGWMEANTLGVTIENCVNAGTMNVSSTNGVGAIAGWIKSLPSGKTYTIQNCYARTDGISGTTVSADSGIFGGTPTGVTGTCTGHVAKPLTELKGAGSSVYTTLDFDSTWTQRTNDVPVPTVFAN